MARQTNTTTRTPRRATRQQSGLEQKVSLAGKGIGTAIVLSAGIIGAAAVGLGTLSGDKTTNNYKGENHIGGIYVNGKAMETTEGVYIVPGVSLTIEQNINGAMSSESLNETMVEKYENGIRVTQGSQSVTVGNYSNERLGQKTTN